jgi:hypothetical protein
VARNTQKIGMMILLLTLLTGISLGVNLETIRTIPINIARTSIGLGLLEACPTGQANCNGQCTYLNNDTQNCGACGNQCPTGEVCEEGACMRASGVAVVAVTGCPAGEIYCNGQCTDPSSDIQNCGLCGNRCQPGSACVSGVCTETAGSLFGTSVGCPAGKIYCNGRCADLSSDTQNCGLCGNRCPPGATCVSGVCTEAAGSLSGTAVGCPAGEIYCRGRCADPSSDPQNCGLCGNRCPPGATCVSGVCTEAAGAGATGVGSACCPESNTNCNGQCVNLLTDTRSCGRCGRACPDGTKCIDGTCIAVACCSEGNTNCNGRCVNLLSDTQNCGRCGRACPEGTTCMDGACSGASSTGGISCPSGKITCNGQCVDPSTDIQNCGTCGKQCPSGGICVSGVCTGVASTGVINCPAGETNCNGKCVDLSSDPRNCGSCGRVCLAGKFCLSEVCSSGLLQ